MEIVGFNHDDLTSGGKAAYTFGAKNLMKDVMPMNDSNTNRGGFIESSGYVYIYNYVYMKMPEELKNVIKQVNKKTSAGNQSTSIDTDAIQIFLFSVNEVAGTQSGSWVSNNEGSKYPVFLNDASRVKKLSNGAGSAQWWWLRSPNLNTSSAFCFVSSDGDVNGGNNASNSFGVCFGFCV